MSVSLTQTFASYRITPHYLEEEGVDCWEAEKGRHLVWNDFVFQIEGAVFSKELEEINKRTLDGMIRAVKRGQYSGGIVPYGYRVDLDTKKLVICEEEAAVVLEMYRWTVDEQISTLKIADRLNAMGVPTRYSIDGRKVRHKGQRAPESTAGIWRAGRVLNMLKNPSYKGVWHWGKRSKKRKTPDDWIPGHCPALVSAEDWGRAQEVIRGNKITKITEHNELNLLRGLIRCARCGHRYIWTYSKLGPKKSVRRRYYRCNVRHSHRKMGLEKCEAPTIRADDLENLVWEDVKQFVKDPDRIIRLLSQAHEPGEGDIDRKLAEIEANERELINRRNNLVRLSVESQQMDVQTLDELLAETKSGLDSLSGYRVKLQKARHTKEEVERESSALRKRLADLQAVIDDASLIEKRKTISLLVREIVIDEKVKGDKKIPVVTVVYKFGDPGLAVML